MCQTSAELCTLAYMMEIVKFWSLISRFIIIAIFASLLFDKHPQTIFFLKFTNFMRYLQKTYLTFIYFQKNLSCTNVKFLTFLIMFISDISRAVFCKTIQKFHYKNLASIKDKNLEEFQ